MDFLVEILLHIVFAPIGMLLFEKPVEQLEESARFTKLPRFLRVILIVFIVIVFLVMIMAIVLGAIMLAAPVTHDDTVTGTIWLSIGLSLLAAYVVAVIICLNVQKHSERKRKIKDKQSDNVRPDKTALRRLVHVVIYGPLGSVHPEHSDIVYGVNYGYVIGGDGEAQDAYVLGVDEPLSEFDGVVIGIIHRLNDDEDKWVVAPRECEISDEEIIEKTAFQESFFETELIRH